MPIMVYQGRTFCLFNKYLLSTHHELDIVLPARETSVRKEKKHTNHKNQEFPALWKAKSSFYMEVVNLAWSKDFPLPLLPLVPQKGEEK